MYKNVINQHIGINLLEYTYDILVCVLHVLVEFDDLHANRVQNL